MRKSKGSRVSSPLQRQATDRNWYIFKLRGCISRLERMIVVVPSQVARISAKQLLTIYQKEVEAVTAMSTVEFTEYSKTHTLIDF